MAERLIRRNLGAERLPKAVVLDHLRDLPGSAPNKLFLAKGTPVDLLSHPAGGKILEVKSIG